MLCTILPVLYLSMLLLPLGLRKMAAPCQSPEGARSGSAIIGYDYSQNCHPVTPSSEYPKVNARPAQLLEFGLS